MRDDVIAHSHSLSSKPEWLQKRLEWFQSMKFGIILHWGPYAQWDCCESWPISPLDDWARNERLKCWTDRDMDMDRFQRDYWDLNKTFDPRGFDPDAWAEAFASSGAKYVCFTTKHHDGFCMWDTATTDYKITGADCPFHTSEQADVTKHLFEACRKQGLAVSVYYSKADWHCPYYWTDPAGRSRHANTVDDPEMWEKFVQYTHDQIRELMTNYGKIDILWLDAGWVMNKEDIRMDELATMARELQPGLIIANRTVGDAYEDFVTPEREIPEEGLGVPWEACLPLGNDWKFVNGDPYKSGERVYEELVEINGKGGNFLLGIGPKPDGTLPDEAVEVLKYLGERLQ